jgi:hypothetical protein
MGYKVGERLDQQKIFSDHGSGRANNGSQCRDGMMLEVLQAQTLGPGLQ